jgi:hypothetical protein
VWRGAAAGEVPAAALVDVADAISPLPLRSRRQTSRDPVVAAATSWVAWSTKDLLMTPKMLTPPPPAAVAVAVAAAVAAVVGETVAGDVCVRPPIDLVHVDPLRQANCSL